MQVVVAVCAACTGHPEFQHAVSSGYVTVTVIIRFIRSGAHYTEFVIISGKPYI